MKYFIKSILIDYCKLIPRDVVSKCFPDSFAARIGNACAAYKYATTMPETNQELLASMDRFWTVDRIRTAVSDFNDGFSSVKYSFYELLLATSCEIRNYDTVIDFGAGSGWNAHLIASRCNANVYCYDIAYKVNRIYNSLSEAMTTSSVRYVNDLEKLLASNSESKKLIYSNMVFSHFSSQHMEYYLNLFKEYNCDLLLLANNLAVPARTSRRHDNDRLFNHNYEYYMSASGYDIGWMYELDLVQSDNKNMIVIYATDRNDSV